MYFYGKTCQIQCILQDVGSHVATPRTASASQSAKITRTEFDPSGTLTQELEHWIDELDDSLPPLRNFILPSGGRAASALHVSRSVCRRAERTLFPLIHEGLAEEPAGKYLNRLSDFLFTAARFAAMRDGKEEKIYKKQDS